MTVGLFVAAVAVVAEVVDFVGQAVVAACRPPVAVSPCVPGVVVVEGVVGFGGSALRESVE